MAAGLGFKTFNTGDVLTAGDTNGYLMQGVLVFADAAARTAAITSPQEGQTSYLKDTDVIQVYSGSAWVTKSGGSPLTTKGDLYTFSTADARLGIGTNGQILTADSAEATGIKWATPAASGGITLIQEQVASANTAIDFTSIPGTYKSLLLVYSGISHSSGSNSFFSIRLNANTGSVYNNNGFYGSASTLTMAVENATSIYNGSAASFGEQVTNATNNAQRVAGYLQIDNYASATKTKTYYGQVGYQYSTATNRGAVYQGNFDSTTAVTQLNIFRLTGSGTISNASDTSIRLYGIS
jgi:hypothetical protein